MLEAGTVSAEVLLHCCAVPPALCTAQEVKDQFSADLAAAAAGQYNDWQHASPLSALAGVLLLPPLHWFHRCLSCAWDALYAAISSIHGVPEHVLAATPAACPGIDCAHARSNS